MISNYLKLAIRALYKHKGYSFINLFGLVGGIASALVLIVYARYELNFDNVHSQRGLIHHVYKLRKTPDGTREVMDTWVPTLQVMREDYPGIVNGVRVLSSDGVVAIDEKTFVESITFADLSLFEIFTLPIASGNAGKLLQQKSDVILSAETAKRFFGNEDPIGKQIVVNTNGTSYDLTVSAVLQAIPYNSSIRPSLVISFENALDIPDVKEAGWGSSFLDTYVLLPDPSTAAKLEALFPDLVKKVFDEETATRMWFKLLPLAEEHNHFTGSNRFAAIMVTIAIIILLVAVINYVNLASARSIERGKEIGLRKVMGASRVELIRQFLGESFLITILSFVVAVAMLQLAWPFINLLLGLTLSFDLAADPGFLWVGAVLVLLVGLLSGSFPAYFISRYKTTESIKGRLKTTPLGIGVRKVLIVAQFSIAVALLFSMLMIYLQVDFMKKYDMGFDKDNVIVVPISSQNAPDFDVLMQRVATMKKELKNQSTVDAVATSNIVPSAGYSVGYTLVRPDGWTEEQPFRIARAYVDESFFPLYGVNILDGENFRETLTSSDTAVRNFCIINEAARRAFGWQEIEGRKINERTQVVGVVNDHNYENLSSAVEPILFIYRPVERLPLSFMSVRFHGSPSVALEQVEDKWKALGETQPFSYFFVDENFETLYRAEDRNTSIITWFSGLTILIACMGLLGLISFSAGQKTKEIGIRKVLGSSNAQILFLLNREFLLLIVIAVIIGLPVATFLMSQWLSGFSVRMSMHWSSYVVVIAIAFLFAFATTSWRALRAAMANPVDSLRSE